MNNIKNFNQFILENVDQPLADPISVAQEWAAIRRNILSLRGKSEDDIDGKLPGFELDNFEGNDEFAYYDLVSPADKDNVVHVVAKLEVENGKITVVSSMNDDNIKAWLENKRLENK